MSAYVLTCSSIGGTFTVSPSATQSGDYVLAPTDSAAQGVVALCQSPAFVPYVPPLQFTQQDFEILLPAFLMLFVTVYGIKRFVSFTGGRR